MSNTECLAEWNDKRIEITGAFDKLATVTRSGGTVTTALLQDVVALVGNADMDIGHVWLQYADSLTPLKLQAGERLRCSVRVREYRKHLDIPNKEGLYSEIKYSLAYPTEVEVLTRNDALDDDDLAEPDLQVGHSPTMHQLGPVEMINEVRRLSQAVGGMAALKQLVEALT